jgi:hypothetical protein
MPKTALDEAQEFAGHISVADIDLAMELGLDRWQREHDGPFPLSKIFAARARQLGWAEGAEFVEEK